MFKLSKYKAVISNLNVNQGESTSNTVSNPPIVSLSIAVEREGTFLYVLTCV